MQRRTFFVGATTAALVPFAIATTAEAEGFHQNGAEWFTNVEVITREGKTLRFYHDVLEGKIVLINFFFTDCDAICPLMTENLARVQELLAPRIGRDIFMTSSSLQPDHDTPAVLAAYAKSYGVKPGWQFVTGKKTISNFFATASALSAPIRSRTRTSNSISAPCASPTSHCTAGP